MGCSPAACVSSTDFELKHCQDLASGQGSIWSKSNHSVSYGSFKKDSTSRQFSPVCRPARCNAVWCCEHDSRPTFAFHVLLSINAFAFLQGAFMNASYIISLVCLPDIASAISLNFTEAPLKRASQWRLWEHILTVCDQSSSVRFAVHQCMRVCCWAKLYMAQSSFLDAIFARRCLACSQETVETVLFQAQPWSAGLPSGCRMPPRQSLPLHVHLLGRQPACSSLQIHWNSDAEKPDNTQSFLRIAQTFVERIAIVSCWKALLLPNCKLLQLLICSDPSCLPALELQAAFWLLRGFCFDDKVDKKAASRSFCCCSALRIHMQCWNLRNQQLQRICRKIYQLGRPYSPPQWCLFP